MNFIRPYLAVGSLRDSQSAGLLAQNNIAAVVSIAEPVTHENVEMFHVPLDDGVALREKDVQAVVDFVRVQKDSGNATLIACALGVSRSASLAVAVVKEIEDLPLLDAYCAVKSARPEVRPHPVLWQSLCRIYGEDVPYLAMLRGGAQEAEGLSSNAG